MNVSAIYQQTIRHFLAPVWKLLEDPTVSDILINGSKQIYFERAGILEQFDGSFPDDESLLAAAQNIAEYVNRTLGGDRHSIDARLPDGPRVHIILPPASRQGVCISIRKTNPTKLSLEVLVQRGALSAEAAEFLELVVLLHKNLVISGGTGSGKTSLLNALSAKIPPAERIVVIEDSSELQLRQPHTLYLEAQPPRPDGKGQITIRDLFVDSLRMRPDRIVIGEVRRGEALDLVQAMLSGHTGALTTLHANTPRDALSRLETLCLMSDVSLPMFVARTQVASAIQLVAQVARFPDGSRRLQAISEVLALDAQQNYQVRDLYLFHTQGRDASGRIQGEMRPTGEKPTFSGEPFALGLGDMVRRTAGLFRPVAS